MSSDKRIQICWWAKRGRKEKIEEKERGGSKKKEKKNRFHRHSSPQKCRYPNIGYEFSRVPFFWQFSNNRDKFYGNCILPLLAIGSFICQQVLSHKIRAAMFSDDTENRWQCLEQSLFFLNHIHPLLCR